MKKRPIILWSCDVKGWAYWTRVETMSRALPQYEHRVLIGDHVPPSLWGDLIRSADIVVCQGVKTIDRIRQAGARWEQIVVRIDSVRVDYCGEYFDIFVKPEEAVCASP